MTIKLKYETGIAATVQFISLTLLNFISGVSGTVSQCSKGSGSCVGNVVLSIMYFLVVTIWFGILWLTGFAAQDRRSRRIAQMLILAEGLVFIVGLYDLTKHKFTVLSGLIAIVEMLTSVWIAWLAFRLMRAKGGRVRSYHVPRHRQPRSQS
jgi:hypothetical protein